MRAIVRKGILLLLVAAAAGAAQAADDGAAQKDESAWSFAATVYPTSIRNGDSYTSAIVTADRGALHLEARYNYESVGARSAFVGWNFSGSSGPLSWELTPLLGGAWGTTDAFVPGLEGSLAWGRVDFYTEIEYVRNPDDRSSRYLYAWNELGFKAAPWLRLGAAVQRTRAYGGDRNVQAGPFAQLSWERFTLGGYWFNPGSADQVVVLSLGVSF
ncbi:hypothetical protein [Variovorax sp. OV329]|uniref:hypothetical protein n=1 Tax=Variovorax sp. OV329 TaxID=1882825 RepID=UPI0008E7D86C|nr:hypothetical protein [Variovorax sp. OV329]SFN38713.1 hypothetical protein SAMN05444747_1242 [Variovorax sp. OV329]